MKMLVVAYACEPGRGSEPEVGWQWMQQLARRHEVWVFTRANNREVIEKTNVASAPNIHFQYVDLPAALRFWKRGNSGVQIYYLLWQTLVLFKALRLNRRIHFDLAHHLTFSPFYFPPLISLLPIPFVWGPIGAGEVFPRQYLALVRLSQRLREKLRATVRRLAIYNPFWIYVMNKSSLIIAATRETKLAIPKIWRDKVVVEAQIGMNASESKPGTADYNDKSEGPFRILTAGRHVYWKGHIVIIRAFAEFIKRSECHCELIILSDGPERSRLEHETENLGIEDCVKFPGWLPSQNELFDWYRQCDVFAYCSFFECGGYVVLEALAYGLPVVSIKLGGPGEIVTNDCGGLVKPSSVDVTIKDFADLFADLALSPSLLVGKRRGAIARVESEFEWRAKGDRVLNVIDKLAL